MRVGGNGYSSDEMSQRQEERLTLCVDFDGVIHDYTIGDWREGALYGEPLPGAIAALFRLRDRGWNVVIHTTRGRSEQLRRDIREWLYNRTMDWDSVFAETVFAPWLESGDPKDFPFIVTATKLPAIAYIDDRAVRFTNWNDMTRYFS